MSDSFKQQAIRSFLVSDLSGLLTSLIFGEWPEWFTQIAHFWWATWAMRSHCSFLVRDLSDSLTSLIKKEGMSKSLIFLNKKTYIKRTKKDCNPKLLSESLFRSFIMSDLSKSLTVAHLSWATWAIRSRSLFWYEQPEQFAYSRSFVLSDLSESLTVAHLI